MPIKHLYGANIISPHQDTDGGSIWDFVTTLLKEHKSTAIVELTLYIFVKSLIYNKCFIRQQILIRIMILLATHFIISYNIIDFKKKLQQDYKIH